MPRTAIALLAACLLCACGQKGNLYLPDGNREAVSTAPVASPAPAATAAPAAAAEPAAADEATTDRARDQAARGNRTN